MTELALQVAPNQLPPRRTMSPVLCELLKDPCFQQAKSPGGAYIITGIRPPGPPTPPPAQQAAEPTNPPTESSHEKQRLAFVRF